MTPAQDMHVPWAPPCVVWKLVEVVGERLHAELFMRYKIRCTDEYDSWLLLEALEADTLDAEPQAAAQDTTAMEM